MAVRLKRKEMLPMHSDSRQVLMTDLQNMSYFLSFDNEDDWQMRTVTFEAFAHGIRLHTGR